MKAVNSVFVVLLRFSDDRTKASQLMDGHKAWLQRGFDEEAFLLAGSLQPNSGGAILARGETLDALQERVNADPFVAEGVVSAEILEITPSKADLRLGFLMP
jgi:uncharacterized protein YciI